MKNRGIVILSLLLFGVILSTSIVKGDFTTVSELVEEAVYKKDLYYYNTVYAEVLKLEDKEGQGKLLSQLTSINSEVFKENINIDNQLLSFTILA